MFAMRQWIAQKFNGHAAANAGRSSPIRASLRGVPEAPNEAARSVIPDSLPHALPRPMRGAERNKAQLIRIGKNWGQRHRLPRPSSIG